MFGITRFVQYLESIGNQDSVSQYGWLFGFLIMVPLYLILIYAEKNTIVDKTDVNSKYERQFLWILSVTVGVVILLRFYVNWFFRIAYYYQIGMLVLGGVFARTPPIYRRSFDIAITSNGTLVSLYYVVYFVHLNYFNNFSTSALINFQFGY